MGAAILFVVFFGISAAGLQALTTTLLPAVRRRTSMLIAAGLWPAAIIAISSLILLDVSFATTKECGADACGMTTAIAILGAVTALIGFVVGVLILAIVRRLIERI